MKINASKVKFEESHFPRDPAAKDGVLFGLTNRFYHLICFETTFFILQAKNKERTLAGSHHKKKDRKSESKPQKE